MLFFSTVGILPNHASEVMHQASEMPLLKTTKKSKAAHLFRLLSQYMDTTNSSNDPVTRGDVIEEIVQILNEFSLKEECFLQIIKRTRENPNVFDEWTAWTLLKHISEKISLETVRNDSCHQRSRSLPLA